MKRPAAPKAITGSPQTGWQILEEHFLNEVTMLQTSEENSMFDLDTAVSTSYADRTFTSEAELQVFLLTLSDEQLAGTEILQDDEAFVVFYPQPDSTPAVTPRRSGYHFDMDGPVRYPKYEAEEYVSAFLLQMA